MDILSARWNVLPACPHAKTDADGRFELKHNLKGPFFLFASARRRVGSTIERYSWKIRSTEIDASGDVMLTNDNLVVEKGIAEGAKNNRGADAVGVEADKTQKKLDVPIQGFIRNQEDEPEAVGAGIVKSSETSHPNPMALPRRRLSQVRPALLKERPIGVANGGVIGVDAHFSEFGDYLQELINIVQIQWDRILDSGGSRPKPGSHVVVNFRINSKGEIAEVIKVEGDAGDYGTRTALKAIQDRAPYRAWTREMVAVLGESQVLTFDFFYE